MLVAFVYCYIFKTATLVHKYLHTGYPNILDPTYLCIPLPIIPDMVGLTDCFYRFHCYICSATSVTSQ